MELSGGVFDKHDLGDTVVTRAAKFRLQDEFKNEPFNGKKYQNDWKVPTKHFADAAVIAKGLARNLVEPDFLPPTKRFPFKGPGLKSSPKNKPDIFYDGDKTGGLAKFHPILTTDYFEFGTSKNRLDREGCAVEMGDAVLGWSAPR